jgi:glutamyl-tRNA reductase
MDNYGGFGMSGSHHGRDESPDGCQPRQDGSHNQDWIKEMKATVSANQKKMEAKVDTAKSGIQEKVEAMINSIWSKIEEIIKSLVEDVLESVDQRTQGLCKERNGNIEETELHLELLMTLGHRAFARR